MRILFINPNTTAEFTAAVQRTAAACALPCTVIVTKNPSSGPPVIQSLGDELLSAPGTLELVRQELENYDGFVIACYSDHPVIRAIRELTTKPVLGIAEASMHTACMLGGKFSIVTTNSEWESRLREAVRGYGLQEHCASVRATGQGGLSLKSMPPDAVHRLVAETARQAILQDGARSICLGGAIMTGMAESLVAELQVPVLDGVICALKAMEALSGHSLSTRESMR